MTTTDTGPDVQVQNADTGECYITHVVEQLDGAATDQSALERWVPPTVPAAVDRIVPQPTPDPEADDLIQVAFEGMKWWENQHHHAAMLHDHAAQIAHDSHERERLTVRDVTTPVYREYRQLCEQIWGMAYHGVLSMTSQPALPVTPAGEAFLKRGPAPAEGFDTTAALNKMASRVKTAVTGAEAEPDGWVEATRLRRLLAWIGSRRKRGA